MPGTRSAVDMSMEDVIAARVLPALVTNCGLWDARFASGRDGTSAVMVVDWAYKIAELMVARSPGEAP